MFNRYALSDKSDIQEIEYFLESYKQEATSEALPHQSKDPSRFLYEMIFLRLFLIKAGRFLGGDVNISVRDRLYYFDHHNQIKYDPHLLMVEKCNSQESERIQENYDLEEKKLKQVLSYLHEKIDFIFDPDRFLISQDIDWLKLAAQEGFVQVALDNIIDRALVGVYLAGHIPDLVPRVFLRSGQLQMRFDKALSVHEMRHLEESESKILNFLAQIGLESLIKKKEKELYTPSFPHPLLKHLIFDALLERSACFFLRYKNDIESYVDIVPLLEECVIRRDWDIVLQYAPLLRQEQKEKLGSFVIDYFFKMVLGVFLTLYQDMPVLDSTDDNQISAGKKLKFFGYFSTHKEVQERVQLQTFVSVIYTLYAIRAFYQSVELEPDTFFKKIDLAEKDFFENTPLTAVETNFSLEGQDQWMNHYSQQIADRLKTGTVETIPKFFKFFNASEEDIKKLENFDEDNLEQVFLFFNLFRETFDAAITSYCCLLNKKDALNLYEILLSLLRLSSERYYDDFYFHWFDAYDFHPRLTSLLPHDLYENLLLKLIEADPKRAYQWIKDIEDEILSLSIRKIAIKKTIFDIQGKIHQQKEYRHIHQKDRQSHLIQPQNNSEIFHKKILGTFYKLMYQKYKRNESFKVEPFIESQSPYQYNLIPQKKEIIKDELTVFLDTLFLYLESGHDYDVPAFIEHVEELCFLMLQILATESSSRVEKFVLYLVHHHLDDIHFFSVEQCYFFKSFFKKCSESFASAINQVMSEKKIFLTQSIQKDCIEASKAQELYDRYGYLFCFESDYQELLSSVVLYDQKFLLDIILKNKKVSPFSFATPEILISETDSAQICLLEICQAWQGLIDDHDLKKIKKIIQHNPHLMNINIEKELSLFDFILESGYQSIAKIFLEHEYNPFTEPYYGSRLSAYHVQFIFQYATEKGILKKELLSSILTYRPDALKNTLFVLDVLTVNNCLSWILDWFLKNGFPLKSALLSEVGVADAKSTPGHRMLKLYLKDRFHAIEGKILENDWQFIFLQDLRFLTTNISCSPEGENFLHLAISHKKLDFINYLFEYAYEDLPLFDQDYKQHDALYYAYNHYVNNPDCPIAKVILKKITHAYTQKLQEWFEALSQQDEEKILYLYQKHPFLGHCPNPYGQTALSILAKSFWGVMILKKMFKYHSESQYGDVRDLILVRKFLDLFSEKPSTTPTVFSNRTCLLHHALGSQAEKIVLKDLGLLSLKIFPKANFSHEYETLFERLGSKDEAENATIADRLKLLIDSPPLYCQILKEATDIPDIFDVQTRDKILTTLQKSQSCKVHEKAPIEAAELDLIEIRRASKRKVIFSSLESEQESTQNCSPMSCHIS